VNLLLTSVSRSRIEINDVLIFLTLPFSRREIRLGIEFGKNLLADWGISTRRDCKSLKFETSICSDP